MTDHHTADEERWIAAMQRRHDRGDEFVCGLADVLRLLAERDYAQRELVKARVAVGAGVGALPWRAEDSAVDALIRERDYLRERLREALDRPLR